MKSLVLEKICKRFGKQSVLEDFSLAIEPAEILVLIGRSGAGKTTLLRLLTGLEQPDSGIVRHGDSDISQLAPHARSVAMVAQDFAMYPQLSIRQNLATALRKSRLSRADAEFRIDKTLSWFELRGLAERCPHEVSGGESQRAAFAKALVTRPEILLLDEPLSQVDAALKPALIELITRVRDEFRTTVVLVTHSPLDAMQVGDRIAIVENHRLVACDTPNSLYRTPPSKLAGELTGPFGMNWIDLSSLNHSLHPSLRVASTGARFVGFRPEDAVLNIATETARSESRKPTHDQLRLPVICGSMRWLGFVNLVRCDFEEHALQVLVPNSRPTLSTRPDIQPGDALLLSVPPENLAFVSE